jgi:hypothetical protein
MERISEDGVTRPCSTRDLFSSSSCSTPGLPSLSLGLRYIGSSVLCLQYSVTPRSIETPCMKIVLPSCPDLALLSLVIVHLRYALLEVGRGLLHRIEPCIPTHLAIVLPVLGD